MNQEDKETEDWLATLSGQSVPNANPETISEAQALRMELILRTKLKSHQNSPNPQILKNIFKATGLEPGWKRDLRNIWRKVFLFIQSLLSWKVTLPVPAVAMVGLLLVIIPLVMPPIISKPTLSEPEKNIIAIPKTLSPVPQELLVSNSQATAEALTIGLAKLGIIVTLVKEEEVWIVDIADLSTANPEALSTLLEKHRLIQLPPPMANQLRVYILDK